MNTPPLLSSDKNPTIKLAKALLTQNRHRQKHQKTMLEGVHLLQAALNAQIAPECLLLTQNALANPEVQDLLQHPLAPRPLLLTDKLYQNIRTLGTGIDMMGMIALPTPDILPNFLPQDGDCLILNDVQDSGNVGTLLRTAAAVGIKQVLCTKGTASVWSPKTLRAGMGAHFSLTLYENLTPNEILDQVKIPLIATSSHTQNYIYQTDLRSPVAWIMGHEGQGVCPELMQNATPIALPQPSGQESLNVAIAGALCLYEMLRQRHFA